MLSITFCEVAESCITLMAKYDRNLLKRGAVLWDESLSTRRVVMMGEACPEYQLALVCA